MKKMVFLLALALVLAGGAIAAFPAPSQAQAYTYPAPPPNVYGSPWVGPNTPWVYYNGDWFLNGLLYYFFGPRYGWAPYYSYSRTYIVRPPTWYGPRWHAWYHTHPVYWRNFYRHYPYWVTHRQGHYYNRRFYNTYHRGYGGGWHRGYHGEAPNVYRRGGRSYAPGGHGEGGYHGGGYHGGGHHGGGHHEGGHHEGGHHEGR